MPPRSRVTKHVIDIASDRFYGCEQCRHADAFDCIDDVLEPLRLKLRERRRLFRRLTCPGCESAVPSGTRVATPSREQVRQAVSFKKFETRYRDDVESFRTFLIRYPMLGIQHPFGQLLANVMKKASKTVLHASHWYRTVGIEDDDFGPRPQHETISGGRYNQTGQHVWYLSSDEKTAAVEKLRLLKSNCPIKVAKIELLEPLAVLDLRAAIWGNDPTGHWILRNVVDRRFVSEPTNDTDKTRPQYRVPQFIADLAHKQRFWGILYDSTRPSPQNNPEAVGHNLVVFDPTSGSCKELSYSTLEFAKHLEYDPIFDLERCRLLPSEVQSSENVFFTNTYTLKSNP